MKSDSSTNIKNNFSAYLDQVKQGQTILILEYGKPIAQISKPINLSNDDLGLSNLERQGLISVPSKPKIKAEDFLKRRVTFGQLTSLGSALSEERESNY
jgi:antitoxin (DNA-binding transcriptional repressor) of toxin-antitoxin stability system